MAEFHFVDADEACAERVFVVQLSLDACPSSGRFYGRIPHMRSCDAAHFGSLDELAQFMRFRLGDPPAEGAGPHPDESGGTADAGRRQRPLGLHWRATAKHVRRRQAS
jgi:hypothetical protein